MPLALTGLLLFADVALLVAAFVPAPWLLLAAAVVLAGAELAVALRSPFTAWTLDRLAGGAPVRALLQGIAVLVFLVRTGAHDRWVAWAGLGVLLVHLSRLTGTGLAELNRRQRKLPLVARGLDLGPLAIPPAPPQWLATRAKDVLSWPMLLLVSGAAIGALAGHAFLVLAGGVLALTAAWAGNVVLARAVLAMRRVPRSRFLEAVRRALGRLEPVVALYFAGGPDSVYQPQMWIEPLEQLGRPALVILRDRETFRQLGPTRLPVLCVEHGNVLMGLDLPALKVALYPSHAVGNLHLLRRRGVAHVFVGHGDSDKPVTTNPFLKAYDEIWVSGPASRERLLAADLGVDDKRVVEIGRPQLSALAAATLEQVETRVRVLYAPTWEGYDDEPGQTSVGPAGVELVRRLVAEPDVRVLYRPHPLLGIRDPAVRRAHHEILALLGNPAVALPVELPDPYARARDELEIAGAARDLAVESSRTELVAAHSVWARRYLNEHAGHALVPGPQFPLHECLAVTNVLLCDVSSVITEFLVTQKPYGVTNPGGLSAGEFAVRYPSSRGGYLVDADGLGLAELLAAARGGDDPAAPERAELRLRLLGPADPPACERLRHAIGNAVGE